MSKRPDLTSPGVLGQMMLIGFMAVVMGLVGVTGVIGIDWVTRSVSVGLVALGALLAVLCLRSMRRR